MSKARELSKLPNYVLSTVAELKLAVGKEQGDKAFVGGYYADGDGGGGDFYWDAVSVEADNGGTIFQVTGTTAGRWKRIYSGSVSVKWFGAKGDGVTDDTIAIQSAIDISGILLKSLYLPNGNYMFSSSLTLQQYSVIVGESLNNTILTYSGTTNSISAILVTNTNGWKSELSLFTIKQSGVATSVNGISIVNINFDSSLFCLSNIKIEGFSGIGLNINPTLAGTYITQIKVSDIRTVGCNIGIYCKVVDSIFTNINTWLSKTNGFIIDGSSNIFSNMKIDQGGSDGRYDGLVVYGARNKFSAIEVQQNTKSGIVINSNDNIFSSLTVDCNSVPSINMVNTDLLYPQMIINGNNNNVNFVNTNLITNGAPRGVVVSHSSYGNKVSYTENTPLLPALVVEDRVLVSRTMTNSNDVGASFGNINGYYGDATVTPTFTLNAGFTPAYGTLAFRNGLILPRGAAIKFPADFTISSGFHFSCIVSPKTLNTAQTYFLKLGKLTASFITNSQIAFYVDGKSYVTFVNLVANSEYSITINGTYDTEGRKILEVLCKVVSSTGVVSLGTSWTGAYSSVVPNAYEYGSWDSNIYLHAYQYGGTDASYALGISSVSFGKSYNTTDMASYTSLPSVDNLCNFFCTYNSTVTNKCIA